MRLQKYLANAGIASRRKSEELILQGLVKVNGETIKELGTKINPKNDIVHYKDKEVKLDEKDVYVVLNKPVGYISTAKDQFDRDTVVDLIDEVDERIYPVGRLDYDTSGLLILTNDGDLTYKLTHPKNNISKKYFAYVNRIPDKKSLANFRRGMLIEGYKTAPAEIDIFKTKNNNAVLKISLYEGKNRQVRKMCDAIGHAVITLERFAIENITIEGLDVGQYRHLTKKEVTYLKNL